MPKYSVRISFRGEEVYTVEAKDEEEAHEMACELLEWDHEGLDSYEPGDPKLIEEKE